MSDFSSRASLAGAVDLSSLKNRAQTPAPTSASADAQANASTQAADSPNPVVPSLVIEGNEANFNGYIAASNSVPLVVEFYASWSEPGKALSAKSSM